MDPESQSHYFTGRTTPTPQPPIPQPPSPSPSPDPYEEVLSLEFVCRRPSCSILNCAIVGSDGYIPYFRIITSAAGSIVFRTNDGRTVAEIEWCGKDDPAHVEVGNAVTKQRVSQWLGVSSDARQGSLLFATRVQKSMAY
ncbi:hypothetical protein B0H14DRAFT_3599401 [Mycena olivaceomarginata]|nr:hypothetical protein B0H14DRAFT_3599401 [Mycena olivaceomarginata]